MFSNKVYDILKYIALIFLPALTTFVGVILNSVHFGSTDIVLTIMTAFDVFLGTILQISNVNYKHFNSIEEQVKDIMNESQDNTQTDRKEN